jgi:hypothetical protein
MDTTSRTPVGSVPAFTSTSTSTGTGSEEPVWSPKTRRRLLAIGGLAYPVLTLLGFVAFPEPPGGDVSAAHDPIWLSGHTGSVIAQSYVRGLAAIGFLLLAIALGRVVERLSATAARLVQLGGAGCGLLLLCSQATMLAAASSSRAGVDGTAIRVLDGLEAGLLGLSSLPAVLMFAGAGAVLLRSGVLPRWFAVITALGVPLALVDAGSYSGGPLDAAGPVGLVYFLIWSTAAGIVLLTQRDAPR